MNQKLLKELNILTSQFDIMLSFSPDINTIDQIAHARWQVISLEMQYSWLIIDKHRCTYINVFSLFLSLFPLFLSLIQVEQKICSRTDCVVSYFAKASFMSATNLIVIIYHGF